MMRTIALTGFDSSHRLMQKIRCLRFLQPIGTSGEERVDELRVVEQTTFYADECGNRRCRKHGKPGACRNLRICVDDRCAFPKEEPPCGLDRHRRTRHESATKPPRRRCADGWPVRSHEGQGRARGLSRCSV